MKLWQKILLIVSILVCLAVIILFWGSIISILLVVCLIMFAPVYLIHKHALNRDNDYFMEYDE